MRKLFIVYVLKNMDIGS